MPNLNPAPGDLSDSQWHNVLARVRETSVESAESLGAILECYRRYLLTVASKELNTELRSKVGDSDIVQEALISAQTHFDTFQGTTREELLRWLRRIVRNRIETIRRQFLASHKRQVKREIPLDHMGSRATGGQLAAHDRSPSSNAALRENSQIIKQALARLPDRYQQVITWRHRDRLAFDEIGRRLEVSPDGARQLWARAIKALRKEYVSGGE